MPAPAALAVSSSGPIRRIPLLADVVSLDDEPAPGDSGKEAVETGATTPDEPATEVSG